jgi:proline dehydrogenase
MDMQLLQLGSTALRKAALNQEAKEFVLTNPQLFSTFKKAADRYIGGETLEETIAKVKMQNAAKFKCSIEFMGENTATAAEAIAAKDEFIQICRQITAHQLHSTVSLDLSHLGLKVSRDLCISHLNEICHEASKANTEVIISAEGHDAMDDVIDIYKQSSQHHKNLAITLQAYLHRTRDDFKEVLKESGRIRMVKGAFETPPELSLPRGDKLDEAYLGYVDQLLAANHLCAIATHHDAIQQAAKELILNYKTPNDRYEFESLYGICNEQLAVLQSEGFSTKIYFVYGREWYLYLCNRIAEYPLNIFRALKDITS